MFAIVIITHEDLGEVYLRCASRILGEQPLVSAISVSHETTCCQVLCQTIAEHLARLEDENEILILVDLFGATPCNASLIYQQHFSNKIKLVAGLNFPMLLKALTIRHLPVSDAITEIISSGRSGIFDATEKFEHVFCKEKNDTAC